MNFMSMMGNMVHTHVISPISTALAPTVARGQAMWQTHGPTIMMWTGVGLNAMAVICAIKAGGEVERATDELTAMKEKGASKREIWASGARLYGKALWKPAVTFALGTCCIGYGVAGFSNQILGLAAAYDGLAASYDALGKEFDEYKAEHPETEDEQEKSAEVSEVTGLTVQPEFVNRTVIRRIFDNTNPLWCEDPEMTIDRLKYNENLANRLLNRKELISGNEYLELAGFPRCAEGYVLGSAKTQDHSTNNYISFGDFSMKNRNFRDFIAGRTKQLILEFSVDGRMEDMIKKKNDEKQLKKGWG